MPGISERITIYQIRRANVTGVTSRSFRIIEEKVPVGSYLIESYKPSGTLVSIVPVGNPGGPRRYWVEKADLAPFAVVFVPEMKADGGED